MSPPRILMIPRHTPYFTFIRLTPFVSWFNRTRATDCGKKMSPPRILMIPRHTPYFAFIRLTPFVSWFRYGILWFF